MILQLLYFTFTFSRMEFRSSFYYSSSFIGKQVSIVIIITGCVNIVNVHPLIFHRLKISRFKLHNDVLIICI